MGVVAQLQMLGNVVEGAGKGVVPVTQWTRLYILFSHVLAGGAEFPWKISGSTLNFYGFIHVGSTAPSSFPATTHIAPGSTRLFP